MSGGVLIRDTACLFFVSSSSSSSSSSSLQLPPARPGCLSAILLPLEMRGAAVRACERAECIHGPGCCGNTLVKLPNGDFAVTIAHHKVPELTLIAAEGWAYGFGWARLSFLGSSNVGFLIPPPVHST